MKKLIITYGSSLILIILLWFLFLISPLREKRKEIRSACSEAQTRLEDIRNTMVQFPRHFTKEKAMEQEKQRLMTQLFSKDDLIRLFGDLQNIAQSHDLTIMEITPSIEELLQMNSRALQDNLPQPLDISVKLGGRFPDIGEFINVVENEKFYHGVNICKIVAASDGGYPMAEFGFKVILGEAGIS